MSYFKVSFLADLGFLPSSEIANFDRMCLGPCLGIFTRISKIISLLKRKRIHRGKRDLFNETNMKNLHLQSLLSVLWHLKTPEADCEKI